MFMLETHKNTKENYNSNSEFDGNIKAQTLSMISCRFFPGHISHDELRFWRQLGRLASVNASDGSERC